MAYITSHLSQHQAHNSFAQIVSNFLDIWLKTNIIIALHQVSKLFCLINRVSIVWWLNEANLWLVVDPVDFVAILIRLKRIQLPTAPSKSWWNTNNRFENRQNPKHGQPGESEHVPRTLFWNSHQHCEAGRFIIQWWKRRCKCLDQSCL